MHGQRVSVTLSVTYLFFITAQWHHIMTAHESSHIARGIKSGSNLTSQISTSLLDCNIFATSYNF